MLNQLLYQVTTNEAVLAYNRKECIVCCYDGENYLVNSYNIFDKEDVLYFIFDYTKLDVVKMINSLRLDDDGVFCMNLKDGKFTNMKTTRYI